MSEQPKPAFGPGSFMWWECGTRNLAKSKDFYSKVIGWTYDEMDMGPAGKYQILKAGDKGAGGMMAMTGPEWGEIPSHWAFYIDVKDVDAEAKRVPELGGKVLHPPTDIPNVGRFCAVQDPAGAHVYLMTPTEHAKEPPCPEHGHFIWVELLSRDFAKASKFYGELLGWEAQEMPMPDGTYTVFTKDGANVGGGMPMPAEAPAAAPSSWVGYIHVTDLDKALATAKVEGAQELFPVMEVPNVGRFTQIMDPAGAVVALMTPAPM